MDKKEHCGNRTPEICSRFPLTMDQCVHMRKWERNHLKEIQAKVPSIYTGLGIVPVTTSQTGKPRFIGHLVEASSGFCLSSRGKSVLDWILLLPYLTYLKARFDQNDFKLHLRFNLNLIAPQTKAQEYVWIFLKFSVADKIKIHYAQYPIKKIN